MCRFDDGALALLLVLYGVPVENDETGQPQCFYPHPEAAIEFIQHGGDIGKLFKLENAERREDRIECDPFFDKRQRNSYQPYFT